MSNVFLTGAAGGIGAALAHDWARRGAVLGLVGRRVDKLEALADTLEGGRSRHCIITADVTNKDDMIRAAERFETFCGGTDIVIACAGISHGVKTEFYEDLAVLEDVYKTNVFATAYTFHPFIAPMKARGRGRLVGIGSVAGIRGLPGSEAYCASKSAVITYCESLRVELGKVGIFVQTLCPGFVKTPLVAQNPYKMPFLMEPEAFAKIAVDTMQETASYRVIPWQMGVLAKIMRLLPNRLFDRITAKRKQKPRRPPSS